MKTLLVIATLLVLFFLATPDNIRAQQRSRSDIVAANRKWKPFWAQFATAVRSRNKASVRQLMVAEKEFSYDEEGGTRNQWLRLLDRHKLWGDVQKSVAKGTKLYDTGEKIPWRITKDNSLLFVFEKGKWRFRGTMGDE